MFPVHQLCRSCPFLPRATLLQCKSIFRHTNVRDVQSLKCGYSPQTYVNGHILPTRIFFWSFANDASIHWARQVISRRVHHGYSSKKDDIFYFDSVFAALISVGIIYFAFQTIGLKFLLDRIVWKDENNKLLPSSRYTLELLYDTIENSHINESFKTMDLMQCITSNNAQLELYGNLHSRFGSYLVLPFYYNYETKEDVNIFLVTKLLDLDLNLIDSESIEMLKNSLVLSRDARRYALLYHLYQASIPVNPFFYSFSLVIFPGSLYQLLLKLSKSPLNKITMNATILIGYFISFGINYWMKYFLGKLSHWRVFYGELHGKTKSENKQKLYNGANEYLDKLEQLNQLLFQYQYRQDGNLLNYLDFLWRIRSYPIRMQRDDIKRFYKLGDQIAWSSLIV